MFVGVDLVKIARWERILEKFPRRTEKIFTEEEIAHCEKKGKKRAEAPLLPAKSDDNCKTVTEGEYHDEKLLAGYTSVLRGHRDRFARRVAVFGKPVSFVAFLRSDLRHGVALRS